MGPCQILERLGEVVYRVQRQTGPLPRGSALRDSGTWGSPLQPSPPRPAHSPDTFHEGTPGAPEPWSYPSQAHNRPAGQEAPPPLSPSPGPLPEVPGTLWGLCGVLWGGELVNSEVPERARMRPGLTGSEGSLP